MGVWGIKALERDEGLDVLDILKNEYVPEHPVMDLGEMIELMKEEVMLGSDFSQIDFLFDNTAMALAELYFQWKDNSKLDYDHEEAIWDKVTGFTVSKEALAFLLRQLTDIKNEVPDEDGIREIVDLWKNEDSGEIAPEWLEHLNQLIDRLDSEQEVRKMYIKKYWGNFIGGSDDSLNLVAFLEDQKKEEIPLSEIFAKIGLDKQNWDFRQTVEYLEFTHSDGVEMDFHFAIDVVTDLAAILLECSVSGSVNLHDLDEYNTPARRIRITVTPEEHDAMNKALADFAQNPLEYDLSEMMDNEEIQEMARDVEALRKELYEAAGRNRDYHVKAEDVKPLLSDWKGADGCIATNRITVEGCKVGYCYREKPDGDWDSGWRFTAGDESEEYMDDPNNAGIYKLNTICNDDPDIIALLHTPAPCAFERDENGVFQQIKDWKPDEDEEDPDMDILKQCQKWHENNEHHKIIEALEGIEERTPEMDSQLARAYNNEADHRTPEGRAMLKKAIALLKPHEEYFEGDYYWNFRMGYSYYYLDQEGKALRYFEKALEARPDDEDTMQLIDGCKKGISLPQFSECFRERTESTWKDFAQQEAQLRRMMDEDKDHTRGQELVDRVEGILNQAFDEISFEMGVGGEKYELILTPEGDKVKLFELVYFQKHAPKEVLEHWNILVGRQPIRNIGLRTDDGWDISGEDVQIWLEQQGKNSFALSAYCEKLLPMLQEEEGRVWWMLTTLTDQVLGEISHMWYIDDFNVLEEPNAEQFFLLSQLPDMLKEKGANLSTDPEAYLNSYLGYKMEPNKDPDADWRLDVMVGSTNCVPLINGYLDADNDFMDALHADGAVAGFFCYPLDTLREEEGTDKIFDFRDKLEEVFTTGDGPEVLTLTGGATGLFCGYVDFIAWDIEAALQMAKEFFEDSEIPWASFHTFRREAGTVNLKTPPEEELDDSPDGETPENEETGVPEVYTEEEMEAIEGHIQQYFGKFENVFHELSSPDIHVDICVVPPSEERDYYTLVTMGMGAHRMNVPKELAEYKLERAELAIALPGNWKLKREDLKNERWYWPIRLLKTLARLPIASDTWLGFGHTMDNEEDFAKGTKLCAAMLTGPQDTEDGSEVCILPSGEEVNFYQVIPLYREELEYKMEHDADALLDKMDGISFVTYNTRPNAMTMGKLGSVEDGGVMEMDCADWHLETIQEKNLPVDEINVYNHMAIYLRWCMEHDLMGEEFLAEYGEVVEKVKADPASVDLREFIRDELDGQLVGPMFNKIGRGFASYYYGEPDSPYFPSDIDDYAIGIIGQERNYSDEIQDEAYLFIPFDEDYYQAMAEVIEKRFTNWQGQDFDEDTLEPSEVAQAIMEYLDCECTYFPSMKDDDPIMAAYGYAKRDSAQEGFVPVLIKADDETLLECLVMNSDPKNDADIYEFDLKTVTEYRKKMLSTPVKDGKAVLEELTGQRKEEAEDDDMDWDEEVLGEMEGGYENNRFSCYWDSGTDMTHPLILAKIPVKNPWEIFAYLPFGNWNECPNTPELMAVAKYWFEQYGAVPAAMSHDELEFLLPAPISKKNAMEVALEQYGFCPDIVDQEPEDATVGALADVLWQSIVWYFWWD